MATYGWTPGYVRRGITGAAGWIYYNWALENEGGLFGPMVERKSDGYVKQEIQRVLAAKRQKQKQ